MFEMTHGKIAAAQKVVIYGPEGVGKSTLAARFPKPLFIDTEGGTNKMDVARFPKPTSWEMLKNEVREAPATGCKTIIIDTIDWAEKLCIATICDASEKKGIEDFGYGKGYVYEREEFGRFLDATTTPSLTKPSFARCGNRTTTAASGLLNWLSAEGFVT